MEKTTPIGVRISVEAKEALAKAAKDDLRSMASLVEKILTDWLREKGYLGEPPKPAPSRSRARKPAAAPA